MPNQLVDINTHEVSIVKRGANRKKFLLYKSTNGKVGESGVEFTDLVDRMDGMEEEMAKMKKDLHEHEGGEAGGGMDAMKQMLGELQEMVSRLMSLVSGEGEKSARDYTKHIPKDLKDGAEVVKCVKAVIDDLTEDLNSVRKSTRSVVELAEELAEEIKGSVSKADMAKVEEALKDLASKIPTADDIKAQVNEAVEAATAGAGA